MEFGIAFAETGHLAMATLHANSANQALDRIINFFPPEARNHILMDLSMNLRAIISQRLLVDVNGKRVPAVEVLINSAYISELIRKGEIAEIKEVMTKSTDEGVQTFDNALFELYSEGRIDRETALSNADSRTNLEWQMNFGKSNDAAEEFTVPEIEKGGQAPPSSKNASDKKDKADLLENLTSDEAFADDTTEGFLDDLMDFDESKVKK